MLAALRSRALHAFSASPRMQPWTHLGFLRYASSSRLGLLDLEEVENVLSDVKADDIRVIPVRDQCEWTDYMVVATGRSAWHVRNIAQALIYKVKQKQKGQDRMLLPSIEGQQGGNWIVIDSGHVIVHALEEKARSYYNLESLWTTEASPKIPNQDLETVIVKRRRKNNSKKRVTSS
ncbi:hypothetical protein J5N97_020328 [Dioscorea zingiberensis]|uniref:Protein Iojap-related, mitochondrial n=1 Tax=Dioscorea zingiberensis TaxID=325984 RepID=A0A9D5CG77_9LILI|nr:hypothetical protein J5N97_020328 [Dioscorea zingiberensis]